MNPEIKLQTASEIAPGQLGMLVHKASAPLFITRLVPDANTIISTIILGTRNIPVVDSSPEAIAAAIGDGLSLQPEQTLLCYVTNKSGAPVVLGAELGAIDLTSPPMTMEQLGAKVAQLDAQAAQAPIPTQAAPTTAYAGTSQVAFEAPGVQPAPMVAGSVPVALAPNAANAAAMPVFGAMPAGQSFPSAQDDQLVPTKSDRFAQHFEPIVRDKNDPRPPPPKTTNVQQKPGVRMSAPNGGGGASVGPANFGRPQGNRAFTTGAPNTQAPAPFREPTVVRTTSRATNTPRPTVQVGGSVPHGAVMGIAPSVPAAVADMASFGSATALSSYHRPVVLGHSVAKSIQNMLERRVPIIKAHRNVAEGALMNAMSLNAADYYGREEQLWANGSVVAWLTGAQIQSLTIIMGAGQGTTENRAGQHDHLPYLVEAFAFAMNPSARMETYQVPAEPITTPALPSFPREPGSPGSNDSPAAPPPA